MRKLIVSWTVLFLALLLFIPHAALANSTQITIGVLNYRSSVSNYGILAAEYLTGDIARLKSCTTVERNELGRIFDEKLLSDSGIVEKIRSGAGQGKGLNYIMMGNIDVNISQVESRDKDGRRYYTYKNTVTMNSRLVDAYNQMGEIIWTSKPITVSNPGNDRESIRSSIEEAAYDTIRDLYKQFPIKGYIIKVEGNKYYVDLGNAIGMKVNDKLVVQGVSDKMIHPVTGKQIEVKTNVGKLKVTEVYEDFCIAVPDNKKNPLKVYAGDSVIRELKSKPRNIFGLWTGGHSF